MSTAITRQQTPAIERSYAQHESFAELMETCKALVSTGFLPDTIRTPAQAAAIVIAGRELGMPMMRSLRSLAIVKGKVIEYADSQLSRFKSDGGRATFTVLDDKSATLILRHPNGDEHTESFTLADAARAGLNSGMYGKFPRAMLRSRVITAGLKSIGWEGGCGTYDDDEIPGARVPGAAEAPTVRHVPEARPSPAPEAAPGWAVSDRELPPPPKTVAEVLAWIASAPFEPESESDETDTLSDVAAWITQNKLSYLPHDLAAFRAAYTDRVAKGAP